MAPSRHNPARRAARAPLQERYRLQQAARRDAAARASGASATSDATTPRTSLDASAEPFDPPGSAPDEVNLPPVDLRDDPDAADEDVFALSCYGGAVRSLTQVVRLDRFTRLASLCVHGCRLTRLEADPALRACAATLVDLNLSSNRIAALEGRGRRGGAGLVRKRVSVRRFDRHGSSRIVSTRLDRLDGRDEPRGRRRASPPFRGQLLR